MRIWFVFIVLQHQQKKVLYFAVTEHPTAEWAGQQLVETFANRDAPRYLVRTVTRATVMTFGAVFDPWG